MRHTLEIKQKCIGSDILSDDTARLRTSIDSGRMVLESELTSLREVVVQKKTERTKKQTVRAMLSSIDHRGDDDTAHLRILEDQIARLDIDIQQMMSAIGA